MMTALIKMGQIEKGCVTMGLHNDLPAGLCAHAGLSPRQIERREEGGEERREEMKRGNYSEKRKDRIQERIRGEIRGAKEVFGCVKYQTPVF